MKVLVGWSGQDDTGSWHRLDAELDETDLGRVLAQHDLSPSLTSQGAFLLLLSEAERLLSLVQLSRGLIKEETAEAADRNFKSVVEAFASNG